MNKIKISFNILLILFFLTGCQSVKENLTMKKKKSADEFLVEKKKPLEMPPDFDLLPKPSDQIDKPEDPKKENIDLSKVLKKGKTNQIDTEKKNKDLEKSISDILKK